MIITRHQDPVAKTSPGYEIERATSSSPQTPVSQLNEEAFPAGVEVEVQINSDGFYGAWYEAKVLSRHCSTRYVKYKIQYLTLLRDDESEQPLVEDVYAKYLRPRAPRRLSTSGACNENEEPNFEMHELVEAYHNDGWWQGVVSGLKNPETDLYTVSFPNSREVFQFKPAEIRPQLDFVNSKWVPILGKAQKKESYREGDKVEVFRLRDDYGTSYFPAWVEEVIHNSYYLVKYESVGARPRPNGDLTEILDPQFLRPAIKMQPKTSSFMVNSHVEVFYKGGWSPGVVFNALSGSNYAVTVQYKGRPMTLQFHGSDMRCKLEWDGRKWSDPHLPKDKKRKRANSSEVFAYDVSLSESENKPDSVSSLGKKVKKKGSDEVEELRSPLQNEDTSREENLDSDEDHPLLKLIRAKQESSKSIGSSSRRIKQAVRKVSQSRKQLLRELKECYPRISTGKRSVKCKRSLNGWSADKKQDEVNKNGGSTSGKKKYLNLSDGSSSDKPEPNTNSEKETTHGGTISCEPHLASEVNYTADLAGENAVGALPHDRTMDHTVGSEIQCLLNSQEHEVNKNGGSTSGKQLDLNLSDGSSSDKPQPNTNSEKETTHGCEPHLASEVNYAADLAGENAVGALPHDRTLGRTVGSEIQCLLNSQDSPSDDIAEISKAQQLVSSQPLNSSTTMEPLTGSQDKSLNPSLNRPVMVADQTDPPPSVLTEHTLAEQTPVKSVTSDVGLPFDKASPLWKSIDALEVFHRIPQTPHFMTLNSECMDKREGTAIGMMVTYANLAESIQNLSIRTEVTVFEEKIACLVSLEENGFIIDPIRARLLRLQEMKTNYTKSGLKRVELETELAYEEKGKMTHLASANDCEAKLADIREKIAKLKEEERGFMEERAGLLALTAEHEDNISGLREDLLRINTSIQLAPQEFSHVIAEPLY